MDTCLEERLLWPALEEQPESRVGTVKTDLIENPRTQGAKGGRWPHLQNPSGGLMGRR